MTEKPINPANQGILNHLGTLPVATFLRDYWQQKPLLVRDALPGFSSPLSPDELADLACAGDTARLVLEKGGATPWEVRHGPFVAKDFTRLPASHWSLLVNDTEQLMPALRELIAPFRFIPDWRIDDLMISFAVPGGSVGPHVDAYDVFLLQGHGQRRWQISRQAVTDDHFIADLDLRVMREFTAEQEWVLNPGDLLYLPPGIAHYGIALNECMTYSIGFRAPSQADLLEDLLGELTEQPARQQRYRDQGRILQGDPAALSAQDLEQLTAFVLEALPDETMIRQWLKRKFDQSESESE